MRVIISGGGTGGHIYPAIAIARSIKEINNTAEILFVGAKGKMEMEKVPAEGFEIKGLWISGFQRKFSYKNLLFPLKVVCSYLKALRIIKNFKPDVIIGVGGYASGPLLRAGINMKIPCLIQEQNSFPGITNRILSKKVNKICVAFEGMEKYFPKEKIILTGNPVRKQIVNNFISKEVAAKHFCFNPQKTTILALGGSLGALTINESIANNIDYFFEKNIQLIWQTGKNYYENYQQRFIIKSENIKIFSFISEMEYAYAIADIIISRAGAIAISELSIVGKPLILVPSPNVAEDHQTKNAMSLVEKNAAILVKDFDARQKMRSVLEELINDNKKQIELSENLKKLSFTNAAEKIAIEAFGLIKNSNSDGKRF